MRTVLTIAGFDPSSGAGSTADLMVFAAHGLFGTSCVTALTVQSTVGVAATHPVGAEVVRATLHHLCDDLPPAGIKIGMLATAEIVGAVADFLERWPGVPVVLDPVIRSSSGRELLSAAGVAAMRERLLPLVSVVTPNLAELSVLAGVPVNDTDEMLVAARRLRAEFPALAVLATGGHLQRPDDLLITSDGRADGREEWLRGVRVATTSTHGTGCAFASALLSRMVLGETMPEAARGAKEYVAEAMRRAKPLGRGQGPLHHLWPLRKEDDTQAARKE